MPERARKSCAYCRGDGTIGCMACTACEGNGFVQVAQPVSLCPCCYGTGIAGCCRCTTCNGSGYANVITDNNNGP